MVCHPVHADTKLQVTAKRNGGITNLVIILGLLILHEKLQPLLPDLWLDMTTSTMALLGLFVVRIFALFLGLVGFAYHLGLAMVPHDGHSFFRILDIPDLLRKSGVRLNLRQTSGGDEILKVCG
jgi:hypothetical protein